MEVTHKAGARITASNRLRSQETMFHVMMLPGMIFLAVFSYIPMVGVVMAFQNFSAGKGIFRSPFVGLKHFRYMFSLPDIWEIIRNTLTIAIGKMLLTTLLAIVFAVLLNEIRQRWLKRTVQTIVYLPHFLSWVILAAVVVNLFSLDGPVNQILQKQGFAQANFLGSNTLFQPTLIMTDVWKEFGYASIVYLAAITSIDPGLYEAAAIDGANWWQRVWHVTLPGMLSIILLMAVMNISNVLNAGFDQVYNLYSPMVYDTGDIIDTYVYRMGLLSHQYSFSTAVGLFKSVVGMFLLIAVNEISKKFTDARIF
ncbi:putative multiple-sugar transport system permease YteP [Caprobacter fermentans]|nr:ABC transporter permease subunit [Caproicibacter fermentans]MVB10302.1 putative multiple-sugar transport system permease YteP [Caproicibacter fermentans]OCN02903.1 sugar ABC transporter permease [Clostridium sp. W14A]